MNNNIPTDEEIQTAVSVLKCFATAYGEVVERLEEKTEPIMVEKRSQCYHRIQVLYDAANILLD